MRQSNFLTAHDIDMERSAAYEEEYLNLTFDPEGETQIAQFEGLFGSVKLTYTPDIRLKYTVYIKDEWDMSSAALSSTVSHAKLYADKIVEIHPKWDRAVNRYW